MAEFTHFNTAGRARMVDVSEKPKTNRTATAQGRVLMRPETLEKIRRGKIVKGDVLAVAQTAGIMGAKRTPDLVPMCHPLLITGVDIDFKEDPPTRSSRLMRYHRQRYRPNDRPDGRGDGGYDGRCRGGPHHL